jgi:hypothetical protein
MGRVDVEEPDLCDLCTQQAFRDFGPFYAGASALDRSVDLLKSGHPLEAMRAVASADTRGGFRALLEVYGAGFV